MMGTKFQVIVSYKADDGTPVRVETSFVGELSITSKPGHYGEEYSFKASGTCLREENGTFGKVYIGENETQNERFTKVRAKAMHSGLNFNDSYFPDEAIGEAVYIWNQTPVPEKVIFNDPATIVYWKDGTKTVVKAYDEYFDEEKGLAMAYMKKTHGNKGNYNDVFRKWIEEEE